MISGEEGKVTVYSFKVAPFTTAQLCPSSDTQTVMGNQHLAFDTLMHLFPCVSR